MNFKQNKDNSKKLSKKKDKIVDDALFNYKSEAVEIKQNQPSFSYVAISVVVVLIVLCFNIKKFFKSIKSKFFNSKMFKYNKKKISQPSFFFFYVGVVIVLGIICFLVFFREPPTIIK